MSSFKEPKVSDTKDDKESHSPKNPTKISFDDYEGSEFEFSTNENENLNNKSKNKQLFKAYSTKNDNLEYCPASSNNQTSHQIGLPSKNSFHDAQSKFEGQVRSYHYQSMNAYSKHVKLVNDYLKYYSGGKTFQEVFKRDTSNDKTDLDVIREEMRFVWDEDEDVPDTWSKRLAKRYYDKLFKEYCICDLTYFKLNKIAMRWRVEKEVLQGKGQFICGDKHCTNQDGLKSWEVNFAYVEHGERKNALVKLRLCPDCSYKLNYHHKRKEIIKVSKKSKKDEIEEEVELSKKRKSSSKNSNSEDEKEEKNEVETNLSKRVRSSTSKEEIEEKAETTKDGNMIILSGGDSIWKQNLNTEKILNESKSKEDDFEDYLEDLLF